MASATANDLTTNVMNDSLNLWAQQAPTGAPVAGALNFFPFVRPLGSIMGRHSFGSLSSSSLASLWTSVVLLND